MELQVLGSIYSDTAEHLEELKTALEGIGYVFAYNNPTSGVVMKKESND